jgi:hypothetical protein
MEYTQPEKLRLEKLLRFDRRLTIIFVIILGLLCIFVFKFLLSSIISVERAGVSLDSVINIIKYHFLAFFGSFGDLTCKYMLLVAILLFINVVGLLAFCLILMIPGPYLLGMYLGRSAIGSLVISKVFYVIIYGLLLIQLFIEW